MYKFAVCICLLINSFCSYSSSETSILGVVMNYDCPHCKKVFESINTLETHCARGLNKNLCAVHPIPFPNDLSDFRPQAYYSVRNISIETSKLVSEVFYDYQPKGPLSQSECKTLLETLLPKHNWDNYFSESVINEGEASLFRAAKLLKTLNVTDYPTFIWLNKLDVRVIPTAHDPSKRIDSVIAFLGNK